jgi:hypothetical protein
VMAGGAAPPSKHCAHKMNALLQSMCFRTDATALGVEWHTAEIRNSLLQSMCFFTDAIELGDPGAVELPFEELVPCDGGKGGARHQSIVLTAHATCRVSYIQCQGNRKTMNSMLHLLLCLRLSLALSAVPVAAHTVDTKCSASKAHQKDK